MDRALRLLRTFETGPSLRSLTDLAAEVELSPSTTHRLLRALVNAGLVRQDPATDHYGLGSAVLTLGARAAEALGLDTVRPVLESLVSATGESVNLGIRDGDEVLVLLCASSNQPLRFDQQAGTRVPAYASAMGKVLLAFDRDSDKVVDSLPRLAKLTGTTITSRAELSSQLEAVREQGFAENDEEREPGVRTVAVPVLDGAGCATAAIAVQGPALRMTDERIAAILPALRQAASEAANRLALVG